MKRPLRISAPESCNVPRLLATLEQLTGVVFTTGGPCEASLCLGSGSGSTGGRSDATGPALYFAQIDPGTGAPSSERVDVQFSNDPAVPWPFHGRTLSTTVPSNCPPLLPLDGERVLASTRSGALWVVGTSGGGTRFRSALPLQEIPPLGSFAQVFSGNAFLANLPLLQLLAQFSSTGIGVRQTPRAAFMFDDPNLHWSSYGYVHYAHLLKQAERENFHVSFATIPLDAWYTHPTTAKLFRDNPGHLSLLVHGNNHTRHELARESSSEGCSALLQQARRRIEQLEHRARVSVDRIMVPPHGACSANMLAALPHAGFEGACLSTGSLAAHNPGADWVTALGFRQAEQILGCAVLPRWALVGAEHSELLVAAYLGRPLVLRGHHGDLREGVELLSDAARFINGLGEVQWCNNSGLMRSSYQLRVSGSTAYVRVFSREVDVALPSQASSVVIEPGAAETDDVRFDVSILGSKRSARYHDALSLPSVDGPHMIKVSRSIPASVRHSIPARGIDAPSVLRRILTETRDRLMPLAN